MPSWDTMSILGGNARDQHQKVTLSRRYQSFAKDRGLRLFCGTENAKVSFKQAAGEPEILELQDDMNKPGSIEIFIEFQNLPDSFRLGVKDVSESSGRTFFASSNLVRKKS